MTYDRIICPDCGEVDNCYPVELGSIRLLGGDLVEDIRTEYRCSTCGEPVDIIVTAMPEIEVPF